MHENTEIRREAKRISYIPTAWTTPRLLARSTQGAQAASPFLNCCSQAA